MSLSLSADRICVPDKSQDGSEGGAMAWNICARTPAKSAESLDKKCRDRFVREAADIVAEVVSEFLRASRSMKQAEALAADFIGVTPRRIRSWRAGDVHSVSAAELQQLRDAQRRLVPHRAAYLRAELAEAESRMRELGCAISAFEPAAHGTRP